MASPDHTPLGRGFDNSLIFFAGAQDHWSNCNCVDPTCAAPNNGFISGHNRSAGAHCWRTIADPLTQVIQSCRFFLQLLSLCILSSIVLSRETPRTSLNA